MEPWRSDHPNGQMFIKHDGTPCGLTFDIWEKDEMIQRWNRRATPPGTEIVPEGTMAIIKAHVGEAYQIAVIKGMALSHIINGSATADKEAFTFANQKNDWGRISRSMRLALDALTRHRATQKDKDTE
jgi:hypothetical protein